MHSNRQTGLYSSILLFIALFLAGLNLSMHKLLWIDETFTQHVSVDQSSYLDILTLRIPDGNKAPLFYLLQKINSNLFSFHYPDRESETSFDVSDVRSQIIVRLPANICMSLALSLIFYFFARYFSLFTAFY